MILPVNPITLEYIIPPMLTDKPVLIHHFLENSACRRPDKIALVHEDIRATYGQINAQANQLARYFINSGVTAGDRIVLLLENSLEYVIGYYAALKAGAAAVPMNTRLKPDALHPLLQELEATYLVSSCKFERLLRAIDLRTTSIGTVILQSPRLSLNHPVQIIAWEDLISPKEEPNLELDISDQSLGSIIYTSGSTGRPKGVMLSHANIVANVASICQSLPFNENDIQMVVLPFFYVMGKSLLNTLFAGGGRIVIDNQFAYPAGVINKMVEEQVTVFSGVPSTFTFLLHQSPLAAAREKLGALRFCCQAGGHMAGITKQQLLNVLPETTRLFIMYGATEAAARLSCLEPEMLKKKIDSIGRPIPGVRLNVLDDTGQEMPAGKTGELTASGDNIMQGYWRDSEATTKALGPQGYRTGDMGYYDDEGYFYIIGRKDHQLKVGGHRIHPQEIEEVIMSTGLAKEVAVLALPDHLLGNRLVAMIVSCLPQTDATQLLKQCALKLPKYKLPQEIQFVNMLPKCARGKIDKTQCETILRR